MSHDHKHTHNHDHSHAHTHGDGAARNIATAFCLNLGFAGVELIGGIATNSVAILSDAVHDFGDSVSLGVAWALQKRSKKGRDARFSYGYKRFSLLGSVFLSGVLLVSSIFILIEAVRRLGEPQAVHAGGMFWLSVAGIVVNGAAALRLNKGSTHNERAAFLHIMEDVLGWAAVLVASVVMIFVDHPVTRFLDPAISLVITAWVLWNVWQNLRGTFRILLQGVPEEIDADELTAAIDAIAGVMSHHDLHLWSQDGTSHVMTLHAVVADDLAIEDHQRIKEQIRALARSHGADHVTVEFESPGGNCEYAEC
jgi:cobalt-zinc-cadmium efflux system protein